MGVFAIYAADGRESEPDFLSANEIAPFVALTTGFIGALLGVLLAPGEQWIEAPTEGIRLGHVGRYDRQVALSWTKRF